MGKINDILNNISHRPFELPEGRWMYYQEWNRALFLHWAIPFELLRKWVPSSLNIDTFDGNCYVSLVAFTMEKIRLQFLPSISLISDFDEVNLRTYIDNDNKKGVYFLSIEAGKWISAFVAKTISGLPYQKSTIARTEKVYKSQNDKKGLKLNVEYNIGNILTSKTQLDKWLTERYCLYLDKSNGIHRYDIHHKEWELKHVNINHLNLDYKIGEFNVSERAPDLVHYSDGTKVIAWKSKKIG